MQVAGQFGEAYWEKICFSENSSVLEEEGFPKQSLNVPLPHTKTDDFQVRKHLTAVTQLISELCFHGLFDILEHPTFRKYSILEV